MEQRKNYNGIDLVKFICAFLVCMIHIEPFPSQIFGEGNYFNLFIQQGLCRLAVPFFFVATGFFLFKKMELYSPNKDIIKDYCFKMFRFIGIWSVLLFVGRVDHLWYLGASAVAIIILGLCFYKRIKLRYLIIIACMLYAVGLMGDLYYGFFAPIRSVKFFDYGIGLYAETFHSTRNGIFMGFIFILMGALFAYKKIKMHIAVAYIGFFASLGAFLAELFIVTRFSVPKDYNMAIFLLPAVFFLFYIASSSNLKDRPIYKSLRIIGVLIFYTHLLIEWFLKRIFKEIFEIFAIDLAPYLLILTLCIVVPLAILIERLAAKERFSWLRYLYS